MRRMSHIAARDEILRVQARLGALWPVIHAVVISPYRANGLGRSAGYAVQTLPSATSLQHSICWLRATNRRNSARMDGSWWRSSSP